jgi:hypothetical protein
MASALASDPWPALPLESWTETHAALHLWLQIAGKIRLVQTPWVNHGWHGTLYVTARGLTTSPIPYESRSFQIDFDFLTHDLIVSSHDGRSGRLPLEPQPVATFYRRVMTELEKLDIPVVIHRKPNEIPDAIRFDEDESHRPYDREYANRFWRALVQADRVFKAFRARFGGKCSPVHLFWGAPDLAVTRFSGRVAPRHPGGIVNLPDWITRDAYSHEVSSCGFWAGGGAIPYPAFYSYAYPEPAGFAEAHVRPSAAFYHAELREFILPYDVVRQADSPDDTLLEFLQSTYDAAADLASWDRERLDYRAPSSSPA